MNAYINNIIHERGDTYSSAIVIEGLGQTVDSIYFTCRENLNDNAEILFQCSINNGISMVEYDEENDIRKYAIRIAPSKTRDLQSGTYYYDLEVGVNSDIFTIMKGKFILEQDATREDNEPEDPLIIVIKSSLDEINGETISVDIVEKLDYLEETKALMKTMINDLGGDLTDTDTFRSYINEIYNVYPKVIGEGTNITLNNTKVAKMKLETDSESANVKIQNKNLLNVPSTFVVTGVANITSLFEDAEVGQSYTISWESYEQGGQNAPAIVLGGGTSWINMGADSPRTVTFTSAPSNMYVYSNSYNGSASAGVTSTIYNLMIRKSTIADDAYELHQEQNVTLPLEEGQYAYSYDNVTNVVSTSTVKATALMKGDE